MNHLSVIPRTIQVALLACFCFACSGCGSSDDADADALLHRQKLREANQSSIKRSPQERLEQAQKDFNLKNYKSALAIVQPLLIETPDDTNAVLLTAKCQAELGNKLDAAKLVHSIPYDQKGIRPRDRYLAVDWFVDVSQYNSAEQVLESVLQQEPNRKSAHRRMTEVLHAQGRRFDAFTHLRALARLNDATEKDLFAMSSIRDPFLDTAIGKPKFEKLIPAALNEAKAWHGDGEISKSRPATIALAAQFPDSTPIVAFMLRVFAEEKDEPKILQQLTKLPNGIEREPEYWYSLGLLHQWQGKHDVAARCFGEAVSRDDTDRTSLLAMAQSLRILGNNQAADRITKRHQLLEESSKLAAKFGVAEGSANDLNRMADIMDDVDRPWESVAWRKVLLRKEGAIDMELEKLQTRREQLAAENVSPWPPTEKAICGVDLSKFPLPSIAQIEAAPGQSSHNRSLIANRPIEFQDVAATVGLQFQYNNSDDPDDGKVLLHQLTGGGIGVVDFDLDGWMDLYLTQGGGDANDASGSEPNRLYRNIDGKSFQVISESGTEDRSYGQGVAAADINQDGFIDLLIANVGQNVICINQGDGTFQSRQLSPTATGKWTTSIAVGDLDRDHLPEIVEVNYVDDPNVFLTSCADTPDACKPSSFQPATDRIWQVNPSGEFTLFLKADSIDQLPNYGFGALIANFDEQHGNDLFVANDTESNQYWVSAQSGPDSDLSLTESAQVKGCGVGLLGMRQGCMGLASGDFDRNGLLDMHVTNFWNQPADLYLQQSSGVFINGVAKLKMRAASRQTVGWGTQAADFDRNGWLDLAVLNGHLISSDARVPYQMQPQLFRGSHTGFEFVPPRKNNYWSKRALGRTMALMDFNRDGKPDFVTNHLDVPLALLENQTESGNHLQLELVGTTTERDAVGAKIQIKAKDQTWTGWVTGGDGFLCTNEPVVDFGIGPFKKIDQVTIDWPSGKTQSFKDVQANQRYVATESEAELWSRK